MKQITNTQYLRKMSEILNMYQDIEDIYYDHTLTNEQRLIDIMKVVREIGDLVGKELPR
jgi:hypothetical protein